jgi:hypothetical protein
MIISIIITVLMILLAIPVILALMILFIPFFYASNGSYYDEEGGLTARIYWLFGLVRLNFSLMSHWMHGFEIRLFGFIHKDLNAEGKKNNKLVKEKDHHNKDRKDSQKGKKGGFSLNMLPEIFKSAGKLLGRYKPKVLAIDATIGFEDAYYTGIMCAVLSTLSPLLASYREIRIRPDFKDEIVEGCYEIQGRITVFHIVYEVLRVYFSKPFREQRRLRKKHRVINADKGVRINNNQVEVM